MLQLVWIGRPPASEQARLRFWQCRSEGASTAEAACAAQVSRETAWRWMVAGRYLSLEDREAISELLQAGKRQHEIAAALGRSSSTISREIARGTNKRGYYIAGAVPRAAQARETTETSEAALV